MTEITHAHPPKVADAVYVAIAKKAEEHPAARMVVMFDPEAEVTIMAATNRGQVVNWTLLTPMSDEATRACLAGEIERGNATEDEIVYLAMQEVAPGNAKLN